MSFNQIKRLQYRRISVIMSSIANRKALEHFVFRRNVLNSKPEGELSVYLYIFFSGYKKHIEPIA